VEKDMTPEVPPAELAQEAALGCGIAAECLAPDAADGELAEVKAGGEPRAAAARVLSFSA